VITPAGEAQLKALVEAHLAHTGSPKAEKILANWGEYLPKFWQVVPPSEADTPEANPDGIAEKVLSSSQS
jgi:glutamate synthase (ferredoxin)